MIFILLFEDNEEHSDKRMKHMEEHLSFLSKNASLIQAAGPLIDAEKKCPSGGLWIVQTDAIENVRSLIEEDPFWPTGLRKNVQILQWNQVFANGSRLTS